MENKRKKEKTTFQEKKTTTKKHYSLEIFVCIITSLREWPKFYYIQQFYIISDLNFLVIVPFVFILYGVLHKCSKSACAYNVTFVSNCLVVNFSSFIFSSKLSFRSLFFPSGFINSIVIFCALIFFIVVGKLNTCNRKGQIVCMNGTPSQKLVYCTLFVPLTLCPPSPAYNFNCVRCNAKEI